MSDDFEQGREQDQAPDQGPDHDRHQQLRTRLGAYALGHLDAAEAAAIGAHLDGCAACRAEIAEIAPLAGFLETVDPDRFTSPPTPPAGLGRRIRDSVADERRADQAAQEAAAEAAAADELAARRDVVRRRQRSRLRLGVVAAALVAVALVGGLLVGRSTAPDPAQSAAPGPFESISLRDVDGAAVRVSEAGVVPHTWGVELKFTAAGFDAGQTYRAAFRMDDGTGRAGRMVPAGQFQGVAGSMTCNLQSSVLRASVDRVVVTDSDGQAVLVADL